MPLDAPGNTPVHPVPAVAVPAEASRPALDPRTRRLLEAPIAPLLLRLAWPNIAVMLAMAATGLIETWWVSRLGLDALAGVALVGTNLGAGNRARALRIAFTGAVGLIAALWPHHWLGLFSDDPAMHAAGTQYLRIVGPAFGFFGMGLALYFASQGAGRLLWPLLAGLLRLLIAIGGGWLALSLTGSLAWLFAALALALVAYGLTIAAAVARGVWFRTRR